MAMPDETRINPDGLVCSGHYAQTMEDTVLPWLKERQKDQRIPGDGGRELFCSFFTADSPRGTALVVHGFTENALKYSELIFSLVRQGFNVCAYDQRGHGRSWRDGAIADPSLTHVHDFNEYVRDMECVCDALMKSSPKPWVIFSHSMGGAVTGLYLERHPGVFARAALCAPMIAPNRGGIPLFAAKALCRGAKMLGRGKKRIFLSKPYAGPEDFAASACTGRERFDWFDAIKASHPEFSNNGPSYDWTLQSLGVTRRLLRPGSVEKIDADVRLYSAEKDEAVLASAQEQFAKRLRHGRMSVVKDAKHEVFRSPDAVVFPWWHEVLSFLRGEE